MRAILTALVLSGALAASAAELGGKTFYDKADDLYFHRHVSGRLDLSVALLEARLKDAPDDALALWRLGRSLVRVGEERTDKKEQIRIFTRAEELIGRSVAIDPESAEAHFWHGLALGRRGEARGMLRSLFMIRPLKKRMRRVLQLDPGHGGAHHVLGRMLFQLPGFAGGSKERAVEELRTALRLAPGYTANYPALAQALRDTGRTAEAREVLKAFFAVREPSDPAVVAGHRVEVESMLAELQP
ncbi:MAG: hypothetical protein ABIJ96_03320 [Elusimicrobiota bacterium]